MRVMSQETTMEKAKIMNEAITYFNGFFGLPVADHVKSCCIEFSNDIGYVTIQVFPKGALNEVVLTTREWEYQVLEFIKFLQS
ncbi:MAG: hypothetical protein ACW98Y_07405 [Candidatus Thorarchaeota archaeon]|jgi:hypothetical protein